MLKRRPVTFVIGGGEGSRKGGRRHHPSPAEAIDNSCMGPEFRCRSLGVLPWDVVNVCAVAGRTSKCHQSILTESDT